MSVAMQRALTQLSNQEFDVLVIGGGAAGAAVAREACIRGFSTALVERDDFGAGTSAHCFKIVHGGIRYLQHADVARMRASCRERAILLRIAPHLVAPLPFVVPTFGRGKGSRWFLGAGMGVYDLLTRDFNSLIADPSRRIHGTRFLSRSETRQLFPEIESAGLTGAAVFEDGQMYNPPRLVLGFVAAAAALGASVANHVEVERLLLSDRRVVGAAVCDRLTGERFDIRARLVINAAGPWAESLLQPLPATQVAPGTYSRDACLVVARKPTARMALALQGRTRDSDALLARNARHMFLVPWRAHTLVGVWHAVVERDPDKVHMSRAELRAFIDEINQCHPALALAESEVSMTGFGLVPFGDAARQGREALSFGKQSRLIDHERAGAVAGLLSLISVRYTVARRDAVAALDAAARQLGKRRAGTESAHQALPGGEVGDFPALLADLNRRWPRWLPPSACEGLARNYGARAQAVLALGERESRLQHCLPGSCVSHAEVVYALREEMAQRMADVVFRRTELGTAGHPGTAALDQLQQLMRAECAWSERRVAEERAAVDAHLQRYLAERPPPPGRSDEFDAVSRNGLTCHAS
jgi:glycerol-3-phosphate dehydrogenase